jgi:hypothetical protein
MNALPIELAKARTEQIQAWNEYIMTIERRHTYEEFHQALNKAGAADKESAEWYRRWQEVGGTSDIESIIEAEFLKKRANRMKDFLSRINSPAMVARRHGMKLTPYGWRQR